ncbi:MAG: sulfatase-like hydrolase/transferase, partial [Planctomycetales bacterium]|nr:sulfatase-like hydrolase/transferase [Planctomycetales bacterium]
MSGSPKLLVELVLFLACASFAVARERPHILFIAVDDLRPELATYGAAVESPNLDRLAESGLRFDRAYCQQAVCGASRLSIMGGLYPTKTGEQTFHVSGWRKRHPHLVTLNQHLGAHGYRTLGLGKIYHGTGGAGVDRANWNRWIELTAPQYASEEHRKIAKPPANKSGRTAVRGPA